MSAVSDVKSVQQGQFESGCDALDVHPITLLAYVALSQCKDKNSKMNLRGKEISVQEPMIFSIPLTGVSVDLSGAVRKVLFQGREDLCLIDLATDRLIEWYSGHDFQSVEKFITHVIPAIKRLADLYIKTSKVTSDALIKYREKMESLKELGDVASLKGYEQKKRDVWKVRDINVFNGLFDSLSQTGEEDSSRSTYLNTVETFLAGKSHEWGAVQEEENLAQQANSGYLRRFNFF